LYFIIINRKTPERAFYRGNIEQRNIEYQTGALGRVSRKAKPNDAAYSRTLPPIIGSAFDVNSKKITRCEINHVGIQTYLKREG